MSKCSHSAFDTSMPERSSSVPTIFFTSGKHEPHDVPALVHSLTPARSVHPCSVTAARTVPAVTLLHEHTVAWLGSSAEGRSTAPSGSSHPAGSPSRLAPTRGRNEAYADASPTRIPPSRVRASSVSTSFL